MWRVLVVIALFSAREMIDHSAALLDRVARNPKSALPARAGTAMRSDPSLRAEIDKFLDGW